MKDGGLRRLTGVGLLSVVFLAGSVVVGTVSAKPASGLDRVLQELWLEAGHPVPEPCPDEVFLRRAHLDITGTLPTPAEVKDFLQDRSRFKRGELIDELLACDEYALYWSLKWGDLLRVKSEFPVNLWPNAVQAYHRWIYESLKANKPYDAMAREILTASGSNFRDPEVNFYRSAHSAEPEGIAEAVALTFMGSRYEAWRPDYQKALASVFTNLKFKKTAEWKEEIVYFDYTTPSEERRVIFPGGKAMTLQPDMDPRYAFADWLIQAENPWFARALVNRVWYWLIGQGIVHEPDDLREDNPPIHPKLLKCLEDEFVKADYDLKHLYRTILNSKAYQAESAAGRIGADLAILQYNLRRLDAEVLADALCQVTGTYEEYSSLIPEPFTFIPRSERSIALADGSITSTFLEMFGRPSRDTGMVLERRDTSSPAQHLHMLNSTHIRKKIESGSALKRIYGNGKRPVEKLEHCYLTLPLPLSDTGGEAVGPEINPWETLEP
jgi:hypothetical protein